MQDSALSVIDEGVKQFPQSDLLKYGFTTALAAGDMRLAEQYGVAYLSLYPRGWWRTKVLTVFPNVDTTDLHQREILKTAVE